jgi:hypothetical protein
VDADTENPRQGRSQSVHSSEEASNDRGAKGHRKLVGVMTVEGYMIQHSAQKAVRAGAAKAAGNRVALRGAAETRMQCKLCGLDGAVKRLQRPGQPISSEQRLESRMPETGPSGLEGGARFNPSSLPLSNFNCIVPAKPFPSDCRGSQPITKDAVAPVIWRVIGCLLRHDDSLPEQTAFSN